MCFDFLFGAGGNQQVCINTFDPFRGIAYGGLFSTLAFLFNIMFLILFILWVISIGLSVLDYIRSQGQTELMEQGKNRFLNIFRGLSLGLFAFAIASGLGILLGGGSPFDWPKNFAQCGPEAQLYMRFREELLVGQPVGFTSEVWCCPLDPSNPVIPDGGWTSTGVGLGRLDPDLAKCNLHDVARKQ